MTMFTEKETIELRGSTYMRVTYNGVALYRVLKRNAQGTPFWSTLNPGVHRALIREIETAMQCAA
ncbi:MULTISPECIES: hypothetical protein [Ralstonia solanacearum species complex]|nr:hypothetical protein [Ralstonia solanacearum]AXV75764.1 hypothetical protein CJO76_01495 [Ralstonia solanacearum]AXV89764.1 hypothetical protein CJO79_01495 [Ralstonia solanacearum]AXW17967.1 hypothetical protein CJO85_01515 [Ralstonia solanacearum]AXW74676.1 hypothetical protein CJO97_01495 [Ralstonia solanacearum]